MYRFTFFMHSFLFHYNKIYNLATTWILVFDRIVLRLLAGKVRAELFHLSRGFLPLENVDPRIGEASPIHSYVSTKSI